MDKSKCEATAKKTTATTKKKKKTLRRKLLKFVLYSETCIETILKYRRGEGHQTALFLFPLATFILTRLGEQCIYI